MIAFCDLSHVSFLQHICFHVRTTHVHECADTDLEHVCVGVMGVLHNDRVAP